MAVSCRPSAALRCVRVLRYYVCPCSGSVIVEYPDRMENGGDITRISPADFAVELVIQRVGVVMLEEDVVCGIVGNGPLT